MIAKETRRPLTGSEGTQPGPAICWCAGDKPRPSTRPPTLRPEGLQRERSNSPLRFPSLGKREGNSVRWQVRRGSFRVTRGPVPPGAPPDWGRRVSSPLCASFVK